MAGYYSTTKPTTLNVLCTASPFCQQYNCLHEVVHIAGQSHVRDTSQAYNLRDDQLGHRQPTKFVYSQATGVTCLGEAQNLSVRTGMIARCKYFRHTQFEASTTLLCVCFFSKLCLDVSAFVKILIHSLLCQLKHMHHGDTKLTAAFKASYLINLCFWFTVYYKCLWAPRR